MGIACTQKTRGDELSSESSRIVEFVLDNPSPTTDPQPTRAYPMTAPKIVSAQVFEVFCNGKLRCYTLSRSVAEERIVQLSEDGFDPVIVERTVEMPELEGELKGSFVDQQRVHVCWQAPCGKHWSDDAEQSTPSPLLVGCGCRVCGERYFLVKFYN